MPGFSKIYPLFLVMFLFTTACVKHKKTPELYLISGAEKVAENGHRLLAENDSSFTFSQARQRTEEEQRSGKYSIKTTGKSAYAMSIALPNIGPDCFIKVSVWRKSGDGKGALVVTTSGSSKLYHLTSEPVETDSLGWGKLALEFYTPAGFLNQELKIYVWNANAEKAYFDDLEIEVKSEKTYPDFSGPVFHIEMDTSEYLKIQKVRKRAFDAGVLQSEDGDWVKGFVFANDKTMRSKMRLKGDWLDHLYGDKWSFRIKLKDDNSWKRMKVFSVQNPLARMGVNEWYYHQVALSEGLLATRYGFIPVTFMGKNMGLYAYEDHFTKHLIEAQKRREGPIVRFREDALWDTRVMDENGVRNENDTPIFQSAPIVPFSSSRIVEDSATKQQFIIAQNLMWQYKHRTQLASGIFNIEMMAKYLASIDVFFARHSLIWHNQRFYYNPVLCKLEPIAYDCYSDVGMGESASRSITGFVEGNSINTTAPEYLLVRQLFNDTSLLKAYISYLEEYASVGYLDSIARSYFAEASYYDSLVVREFPEHVFDTAQLLFNARKVRDDLPEFKKKAQERIDKHIVWENEPKTNPALDTVLGDAFVSNLINCYVQEQTADSITFKLVSFFPEAISVVGTGKKAKFITNYLPHSIDVLPYRGSPNTCTFTMPVSEANYLFVLRSQGDEVVSTEIFYWPEPNGALSPLQELLSNYAPTQDTEMYTLKNNQVLFNPGNYQVNHPLIFPQGMQVVISAGTTIDLIEKAMFISFSPVSIIGSETHPVVFTSSDFSANGFAILQAGAPSHIEHAVFENLNTLDYKGWSLSGAVNFYESEVELVNTRFYRNQCEDALNIIRSEFVLDQAEFDFTYGDAFDSDFSVGIVKNTLFTNIGNDAIDFSGSQIAIVDTRIVGAQDKGISGGEDSQLTVENVWISNCNIGVASKDFSVVEVKNSTITECTYGLVLLQKKPEYGPATLLINQTQLINNETPMLIEKGSVVIENGKRIEGAALKVATLFY